MAQILACFTFNLRALHAFQTLLTNMVRVGTIYMQITIIRKPFELEHHCNDGPNARIWEASAQFFSSVPENRALDKWSTCYFISDTLLLFYFHSQYEITSLTNAILSLSNALIFCGQEVIQSSRYLIPMKYILDQTTSQTYLQYFTFRVKFAHNNPEISLGSNETVDALQDITSYEEYQRANQLISKFINEGILLVARLQVITAAATMRLMKPKLQSGI